MRPLWESIQTQKKTADHDGTSGAISLIETVVKPFLIDAEGPKNPKGFDCSYAARFTQQPMSWLLQWQ